MRKNIQLLVIVFLTAIAWYKILFQTFIGEGYYYFFGGLKENSNIFRFDIGAALFFDLLKPIFKDNFFFYQAIAFLTLILLGILFYLIVYQLTRQKSVAFIASILFSINYNTTFEMVATGAYQNFVQRVFFLLVLFPSLIFFIKFIDSKKNHYYLISLVLAILSTGFAYFSFFYIPFIIAYTFAVFFTQKMRFKKIFYLFSCTLIYIFTSLLIVNTPGLLKLSNLMPSENILIFIIKNVDEVIIQFLRQLTVISIPGVLFRQFFSIFNISYTEFIYFSNGVNYFYFPVLLIYIFIGIFLYKREKKLRPVIIASLFFLPCIFVLNMYMRSENISRLAPGSRYLYVASIAYSIFWGIFLTNLYNRSVKAKIGVYLIISGWIIMQILAINRQLQIESGNHIETKKIIAYFKNNLSSRLKEDSIVITPYSMGNWGSWYLNMFYGKKNTIFTPRMTSEFEWEGKFKSSFNPKKDYIIYYDESSQEVIDVTKNYKTIIKTR